MRQMPSLRIETAKVADLLPYIGNAKLHPHVQVDQIAKSIEEFGNNDPIAVWHNEDGEMEVVEGHGRLLALKKLGIEECPVISLDHLTDEQRRAYTHIHNQLTMNSDFDFEILDTEMSELDFDWEGYGFENVGFDWDFGVPELSDDTYEEPDTKKLMCPSCGHVDEADRFKRSK